MCTDGFSAVDCGVGVAAATWSVISLPIEDALVKFAPKITTMIGDAVSTHVSRVLRSNSNFIVH